MAKPNAPRDLPLTPPVFHILMALADGERHGYGIMRDVAHLTGGALLLGFGTLDGCLKRTRIARLVAASDERPELPLPAPAAGRCRIHR